MKVISYYGTKNPKSKKAWDWWSTVSHKALPLALDKNAKLCPLIDMGHDPKKTLLFEPIA